MFRVSALALLAGVVVLVATSSSAVFAVSIVVKPEDAACSQYTRCSECIYDATAPRSAGEQTTYCAWCPSLQKCAASFADGSCPDNRTLAANSQCEDMQCLGARITGNIYLCRTGMVIALVLSILLMVVSVVYAVWYRAIQQAPWRYGNLTFALDRLIAAHGGAWSASQKAAKQDVLSADRDFCIRKKDRKLATYDQWAFGCNDEERFWNQVKRYAFFPMAISGIIGCVCTILLFATSLRPYFADAYYGVVLSAGYGSVLIMAVFVRMFQPPVCERADGSAQTYFDLAVFLRGRSITSVFPVREGSQGEDDEDATSPGAASAAAAAAGSVTIKVEGAAPAAASSDSKKPNLAKVASEYEMTPLGVDLKNASAKFDAQEASAAASSGFELDESVPADFRARVQELVKADEAILWFDSPDRNVVGIEYNWMYQLFFAGIGFSIFMYVLSGVTPYPALLLPASNIIVIALLLTFASLILLAILSAGCKRVYVMTNTRLIVVARSLTGTHSVNSVLLSDIKYCTLIGYKEMNHFVVNVAWERAGPALRRMPKLNTDRFIAVKRLDSLLALLVPRLPSNALPATFHDDLVHQRYVWRVHASAHLLVAVLSPVLIMYSNVFPGSFSVVAMLLVMFVNSVVLQRAIRVLTTTVTPITVATGSTRSDSSFSISKTIMSVAETVPDFFRGVARHHSRSASTATAAPEPEDSDASPHAPPAQQPQKH